MMFPGSRSAPGGGELFGERTWREAHYTIFSEEYQAFSVPAHRLLKPFSPISATHISAPRFRAALFHSSRLNSSSAPASRSHRFTVPPLPPAPSLKATRTPSLPDLTALLSRSDAST